MGTSISMLSSAPLAPALAGLVLYATICHALRFRRVSKLKRRYGFGTHRSLSSMTDAEAHEIQLTVAELEFPTMFEKGLQLALLRTYGIPSISKLLVKTAQLSTNENVGKRYADTTIIISEIYDSPPKGEKGIEAFARLNYLHGHYIKQGRISNDDMLYTLALFMNHPCEVIDRYEWRSLTDVEVCAIATFHKSMGDAMRISYDVLPGAKTGWTDGLHFYRELDEWAKQYEASNMTPHQDNHLTAVKTKELLLSTLPRFTHGTVVQILAAAMDDKLRRAIMFTDPHALAQTSLDAIIAIRRFVLRHFALPRPEWLKSARLSDVEGADGRRWITNWDTTPHYVRPTVWNRWGPMGLYQLAIGAARPGDEGMCPEGYLRSTVGPRAFNGKGLAEMDEEKSRIRSRRTGGCPFSR